LDLVIIGLLIYQIAVYIHFHRMKYCRDSRMWIYGICLVISLYVFFHYAIMNPHARMNMLNVMDFCRFIIMSSLCIFFCKKASKLLKNYKFIVKGLILWVLISFIAYVILAFMIHGSGVHRTKLCLNPYFKLSRMFPLIVCIAFLFIYFHIKRNIMSKAI